jgi:hypothetical protein
MRKVCVFALLLSVGVAGAPASVMAAPAMVASAQAESAGKLVGVLKDAAGKPLQNATVNIVDQTGKVVGSVVTDSNGLFSVANLPAGNYSIQAVNSVGQALAGSSAVSVAAGSTTTITATATATGGIAVAGGSAGFIAALGGPIAAAALASAGVVGAVAIQQALKDASPSR